MIQPISSRFRLMGHIYSAPYAWLEPQLAFVVEDQESVAGFVVGTVDTMAWEEKLERLWWPSLRRQYAIPPEIDAERWTHDQRRIVMIHRPTHTPPAIALKYPAHLHLNILPLEHSSAPPRTRRRLTARRSVADRRRQIRRKGHACRNQPGQCWRGAVLGQNGLRRCVSRWAAGRANHLERPSMNAASAVQAPRRSVAAPSPGNDH